MLYIRISLEAFVEVWCLWHVLYCIITVISMVREKKMLNNNTNWNEDWFFYSLSQKLRFEKINCIYMSVPECVCSVCAVWLLLQHKIAPLLYFFFFWIYLKADQNAITLYMHLDIDLIPKITIIFHWKLIDEFNLRLFSNTF